ncbi:hypothetical protein [Corynebacterium kozikiae]|uniref:hypothetical protein n=1 Tax=Corynebacterium kozikiae TaxID=2968469 RepID=UPI00211BE37B|nr:hypothetical protein [Corynebacterium sp. 76QC2CO]MCQ9342755.1 hypothetical protein [Corynebacterium sp. 76QC2CO]
MGVERQAATALAAEIDALLGHLDAEHTRFSAQLAAVAPEHSFGAHNLVDYAYLRSTESTVCAPPHDPMPGHIAYPRNWSPT